MNQMTHKPPKTRLATTCAFCKMALIEPNQHMKCKGIENCPLVVHKNCFQSICEILYIKGCQFVCKSCAIRQDIELFLKERQRELPFEPIREKPTYENRIRYEKNALLALRYAPASKIKPENLDSLSCFKTIDETLNQTNQQPSNVINKKNKNKPPQAKKQTTENTPPVVEPTKNKQPKKNNVENKVLATTDTPNEPNKEKQAKAKKQAKEITPSVNEKIYKSQAQTFLNSKSSKHLSFDDIQNRLNILLKGKISIDDIIGWITLNVGYRIVEEQFIRALSNAVFENCIIDKQVSNTELNKYERLLEHFIRNITKYEVECLYSLQHILHKSNILSSGGYLFICFKLYSDNIITKEGFLTWKSCQNIAEQEGKDEALQQLQILFNQMI